MVPGSTNGSLDRPIGEIISLKVRDRTHAFTIAQNIHFWIETVW